MSEYQIRIVLLGEITTYLCDQSNCRVTAICLDGDSGPENTPSTLPLYCHRSQLHSPPPTPPLPSRHDDLTPLQEQKTAQILPPPTPLSPSSVAPAPGTSHRGQHDADPRPRVPQRHATYAARLGLRRRTQPQNPPAVTQRQ